VSPVVLVSRVGAARGSLAAAAALACSASEPDWAALLIDLADGRAPRPTLVATAGSRKLEERLVAHLPAAAVASRGQICQLTLPASPDSLERIAAALPLVRESAAIVHLSPSLLRGVLGDARIRPTGVLLRSDLTQDRSLTALAARDLIVAGLRVTVLKRPLGWLTERAARLGALPAGGRALPVRPCERLLHTDDKRLRQRYLGKDGSKDGRQEIRTERRRP
jgi:hypothetical protein